MMLLKVKSLFSAGCLCLTVIAILFAGCGKNTAEASDENTGTSAEGYYAVTKFTVDGENYLESEYAEKYCLILWQDGIVTFSLSDNMMGALTFAKDQSGKYVFSAAPADSSNYINHSGKWTYSLNNGIFTANGTGEKNGKSCTVALSAEKNNSYSVQNAKQLAGDWMYGDYGYASLTINADATIHSASINWSQKWASSCCIAGQNELLVRYDAISGDDYGVHSLAMNADKMEINGFVDFAEDFEGSNNFNLHKAAAKNDGLLIGRWKYAGLMDAYGFDAGQNGDTWGETIEFKQNGTATVYNETVFYSASDENIFLFEFEEPWDGNVYAYQYNNGELHIYFDDYDEYQIFVKE
jgi:hypothetical protein